MEGSPFAAEGDRRLHGTQREFQRLYALTLCTLAALLISSVGVNVFFLKQLTAAQKQLNTAQSVVINLSAQYRQKEPAMRQFVAALQEYSATNSEFAVVLYRYRRALPQFFTEPSKAVGR